MASVTLIMKVTIAVKSLIEAQQTVTEIFTSFVWSCLHVHNEHAVLNSLCGQSSIASDGLTIGSRLSEDAGLTNSCGNWCTSIRDFTVHECVCSGSEQSGQ